MDQIEKVCSFTGHRPEKMKATEAEVKEKLSVAIKDAIAAGYDTFLSGMAPGVDIWAAEVVLEMRRAGVPISLVAVVPYALFGLSKQYGDAEKYNDIVAQCTDVQMVSNCYHRGVFHERDRWLVDNSSLLIAVYNGTEGGTKYTMEYATKKGVTFNSICVE